MRDQPEHDVPSRGMRINTGRYSVQNHPSWATFRQREKWNGRGLVLWDSEVRQVIKLSAIQALGIRDHLCADDGWQRQGITIGEPAVQISLDHPEREPEQVLLHQIDLSPDRSRELLEFLDSNSATLEKLGQEEEKERSEILDRVYSIILGETVWTQLCRFYQVDPEETLKVAQKLVARKLDLLSAK